MTIKVTLEFQTTEEALTTLAKLSGSTTPSVPANTASISATTEPARSETEAASLQLERPKASAAVLKYAAEKGIAITDIEKGSGKDGRIVKGDITALWQTRQEPEVDTSDDSTPESAPEVDTSDEFDDFDDFDDAPAEATKDDVRKALITYQTGLRDSLIGEGEEEKDAIGEAKKQARALLKTAGGSETLGGLDKARYGAVVKAAKDATAALL